MKNSLPIPVLLLLAFFIPACALQQQGSAVSGTDFLTHYRTFGQGDPVLIINGGPGMNSDGFAAIAEEIAALGYQTIIYDQRGTGKSALPQLDNNHITMDLMVKDMEDLRKRLGFQKWTVFGHSFGGLLATHYVAKHPEAVERLIFSSSGGVNLKFRQYVNGRLMANLAEADRDSLQFYQAQMANGNAGADVLARRAKFLARAYVFDKAHAPTIAQRLTQINFEVNRLVFEDLQKIQFNYTDAFRELPHPVLVIQGKNDIISVETAQEIHSAFGNAKLVLLDNCGHYGWLDAKQDYLAALKAFLSQS